MTTSTNNARRRALTFGIIGAGVAIAVIVGVLFAMPLITKTQQPPQTQPQQPQQGQESIPQRGEEGYLVGQELEQLKQQDPQFARFDQIIDDCASNTFPNAAIGSAPPPGSPSASLCQQEIQRGLANWCGPINTPNYHAVKCEQVQNAQDAFDIVLR
jgi:hypothetical protein